MLCCMLEIAFINILTPQKNTQITEEFWFGMNPSYRYRHRTVFAKGSRSCCVFHITQHAHQPTPELVPPSSLRSPHTPDEQPPHEHPIRLQCAMSSKFEGLRPRPHDPHPKELKDMISAEAVQEVAKLVAMWQKDKDVRCRNMTDSKDFQRLF